MPGETGFKGVLRSHHIGQVLLMASNRVAILIAMFGSFGTGRGQLKFPSDVAVDPDGEVYVCDWANNRVQLFDPNGRFITSFRGDAQQLTKWSMKVST